MSSVHSVTDPPYRHIATSLTFTVEKYSAQDDGAMIYTTKILLRYQLFRDIFLFSGVLNIPWIRSFNTPIPSSPIHVSLDTL